MERNFQMFSSIFHIIPEKLTLVVQSIKMRLERNVVVEKKYLVLAKKYVYARSRSTRPLESKPNKEDISKQQSLY